MKTSNMQTQVSNEVTMWVITAVTERQTINGTHEKDGLFKDFLEPQDVS